MQYAQWEAYFNLEPFGYPIDSFRFGQICATVANFSFGSKKRNFTAADFVPKFASQVSAEQEQATLGNKILGFFKGLVKKG